MAQSNQQIEFLSITKVMAKIGIKSRTTFWKLRKKGDIPAPVIADPPTWRNKDIDEFFDARAKALQKKSLEALQ